QTEMQSLLGFTNFLREQIPLYARLVGPLQALATKKNWKEGDWGDEQEKAFQRMKKVLQSAPVIHEPDFDKDFHIATDASQFGVGAVLYQMVDGERKYVAFGARALRKGQKNYPATKRELLAIMFALHKWEHLLLDHTFSVETDNKALIYLHKAKSYMARDWARFLAGFRFTISHKPGVENVLPHHLSHLYGLLPKEKTVLAELSVGARRSERLARRREEEFEKALDDAPDPDDDTELQSDSRPSAGLRHMEKEFAEGVLEAKFVESLEEREALLKAAHKASHQGPMGTFEKLFRDGYFWTDMMRDARRESQRCRKCLRHNVGKRGFHAMTGAVVQEPLQRVHIDLLGALLTSEGRRYILVMVDSATRFIWLRALKDTDAFAIAKKMIKIFNEFGWPDEVVTDGASNLSGSVMSQVLNLIGVSAKKTIPGVHEQNAAVERAIKEVRLVTAKRCDRRPNEWHQ
ncbi:MAG: RNase H-like domain-containing protein, partial [Methylococcales bacterium]